MGSLTSRPKVPQAQQPVFVTMPSPAPVPVASPAPVPAAIQNAGAPGGASDTAEDNAGTDSPEAVRLAREDNLLRRGRGRLGTVLTGFSGILSQAAAPLRKTLLGE